MEVIKQGLKSVQKVCETLQELLNESKNQDPLIVTLTGFLMDIQCMEPTLKSALNILEPTHNAYISDLTNLEKKPVYEWVTELNSLDIKLKQCESQLVQKEAQINYLTSISDSKNSIIKEVHLQIPPGGLRSKTGKDRPFQTDRKSRRIRERKP